MLNRVVQQLPTIPFAAAQQQQDLPQGLYLQYLELTIDAVLGIAAGGGADGTVVADGVARLIRDVTIKWDNFDLVQRISGRDILMLTKRASQTVVPGYALTTAGVGAQTLHCSLLLPFARPWLVDRFNTVLPPLKVTSQFKIYVNWDQTVNAGAGSAAGTGVLVDGGTRVLTWTTAPTLTVTAYGALQGVKPWFIPVYSSFDTEQFAAANPRLIYQLVNNRRVDAIGISPRDGTLAFNKALLNNLTFQSSGVQYYGNVTAATIKDFERMHYPAVEATDLDYFIRFADGGKLGNVLEPSSLSSPRFEFNVAAPVAPGLVHLLMSELITHPDYTEVQDKQ